MRKTNLLSAWAGIALAALVASCSTTNVSNTSPDQVDDQRGGSGVKLGAFEVVRHNQAGFADPSLNNTLSLDLQGDPAQPDLVITVQDAEYTTTVALDVKYNGQSIHPESVDFHGLMGTDAQVLSASFLHLAGTASLGQAAVLDYAPGPLNGSFATLHFAPGAVKEVMAAGDVHHNPAGVGYEKATLPNLTKEEDTTAETAAINWTTAWHIADGDQNSEANISDLTPIAAHLGESINTVWGAVVADYDNNTEVNISDLTPLAAYLQEGTTGFVVEVSDDVDGAARTEVATPAWADNIPAVADPSGNTLEEAFKSWRFDFDAGSAFTYAQVKAVDTNTNGNVRFFITPQRDGAAQSTGAEASIDVAVSTGSQQTTDTLTVTDFVVQITGATGGAGTNGDEFGGSNLDAVVPANGSINCTLLRIVGNFNGSAGAGPFDGNGSGPVALPNGMETADYDMAFNAVRDYLTWTMAHNGAAGFRRTADWAVFGSPSPITGDPGAGTIFPDFDPETDPGLGGFTEGRITINMPQEGIANPYPGTAELDVNVLAAVSHQINVDVTADPNAHTITDVQGDAGQLIDIPVQVEQNFTIIFDWANDTPPATPASCQLELLPFAPPNELPTAGSPAFTYVPDGPDVAGEFTVQDFGGGTGVVIGIIPGGSLEAGASYHFRFFDGSIWTSVNIPDWMHQTQPPPPPQDLLVVPDRIGTGRPAIQIFYEDPMIRRNPRVLVNILTETVDIEDPLAYNDVLKSSGDEFIVQYVSGVGDFPRQTMIEGNNPAVIDETTASLPGPFIIAGEKQPNRICVDVLALPKPDIANPTKTFAFKIFDKNDIPVGQGTFQSVFLLPDVPNVVPIDFGVNAINRTADDIAARDFTDKNAEGSTIDGATPDVLWFEFADGWMFDFTVNEAQPSNNVVAVLTRQSDDQIQEMRMPLRVAGLGSGTTYICIHPLVDFDFVSATDFGPIPGWPGILDGGQSYQVQLDDPTKAGIEGTYPDLLFVGSSAPYPNPD